MTRTPFSVEEVKAKLKPFRWCLKLFLDRRYWLPVQNEIYEIASQWIKTVKPYVADKFDCDDFARSFKCFMVNSYGLNGVGYVLDWLSRHAYNIIITADAGAYIFEPQTGEIISYEDRDKRMYSLIGALVLF